MRGERIKITVSNSKDKEKLINFKNKNFPNLNLITNDYNLIFEISDIHKKSIFESSINQSLEIVRNRIDESGTKEPLIQRQGIDRILLQLPGIKDPERIKVLLGKTAKLNFHMVDDQNLSALSEKKAPPGKMIVHSQR